MKSSTKYHALIDSEEDQSKALAIQETPTKDDLDYFYIWIAIVLLAASCIIMQVAWYLHLKYDHWNYFQAIFFSWLIALFEYMLQVPANKLGHRSGLSSAHLRAVAEIFILTAFLAFNKIVLGQKILWNHVVGFLLVGIGVLMVLMGPFEGEVVIGSPVKDQGATDNTVHTRLLQKNQN